MPLRAAHACPPPSAGRSTPHPRAPSRPCSFGAAHRLLRNTFGQQLEDAPPHSLLVWLALALDTDKRGEAQRLIQSLLDSRHPDQPGEGAGGGG